jgi:transposase
MSVYGASRKVNMTHASAIAYYKLYKNDPEKKIPLPRHHNSKIYTQEQIGNLIRYFNDDKMAVTEASAKAGMPYDSGYHYYKRYLKDPNHTIPIPRMKQSYTQDQKNEFIDYIVRDKTSINAASKKAKMHISAANYYYHKYFEKQNLDVPTPSHIATHKYYTQEQINQLISYITNDKMSIDAASRKANIPPSTARGCYRQYVKDNNIKLPVTRKAKAYTGDEINKLIGYIVDNKMSINAASKKANMSAPTGIKYYRQYLKEHHLDYPIQKVITQEQKNELIGYIVDTKMTIKAASKKANMCETTDHRYYQQYLNDNY